MKEEGGGGRGERGQPFHYCTVQEHVYGGVFRRRSPKRRGEGGARGGGGLTISLLHTGIVVKFQLISPRTGSALPTGS